MLRLLIPLVLIWPVLALAAEASPLRHYRATPARELSAMAFCIVTYFILWIALHQLGRGLTGSEAAAIVVATVLSLLAVTPLLAVGYKIFRVRRGAGESH
ncbi:MAG: hypothetical protein PVJ64_00750 [Gemmatimonadales bacterium]|jgi:hypothetical protein